MQFVNSQQQKNERVNKLVLMCFYYSTLLAVMEVFFETREDKLLLVFTRNKGTGYMPADSIKWRCGHKQRLLS